MYQNSGYTLTMTLHLPEIPRGFLKRTQKNQAPKSFLALDIGTASVKAALFSFLDNGHVTLLGFGRAHAEDSAQIADAGLSAYNSIKSTAENPYPVKNIIFGLSAKECYLTTTSVKISRKNPQSPITQKEIAQMTEKIQNTSYIESAQALANKIGSDDVQTKLLNSDYIYTKVDGVEVANLDGYKGETVEASLFSAFTTTEKIAELSKIASDLNLKTAAITSNIYTIVKAIKRKAGLSGNRVIIDIGGGATDVAVIFGGGIAACLSISLGASDIVDVIAKDLKVGIPDAQKLLDMYVGKNLDAESVAKVGGLIAKVAQMWSAGIEHLFKEFEGIKVFPGEIILAGWGSAISEYKNSLTGEWSKDIPFKSPPVFGNFGADYLDFIKSDKKDILDKEGATLSLSLAAFELWHH